MVAELQGVPRDARAVRRLGDGVATRRRLVSASGVVAVVALWELLAVVVFAGRHILPTPTAVVTGLWDNRQLLWANTATTVSEAGLGWLWGNALAIGLGLLFVLVPPVEAALLRLAIASYCMPVIAIAPILNIVFSGNQPKVVLAALGVFFTTLVGMTSGLRSADTTSLDVVRAYGGSAWTALVKVRVRAALPSLFAALRIAAPAALLGAIIGEYLGGSNGLGVAMINAEQSLDVTRVWDIALFAAALAGVGYALAGGAARLVTPWAGSVPHATVGGGDPAKRGRVLLVARSLLFLCESIGVTLLVWIGFIKLFGLNPYFAKSPADVWTYLTHGAAAAANRSELWHTLVVTLRDASLGYVAGSLLAVAMAMAIVSFPTVEATFLPIAIVLRSVPLVAMTPLISLALGRGLVCVTVIAGIVTFFPTLVNVVEGLRSAPNDSIHLMEAYDASALQTLVKVRLPSALPSLFSSARIAVPGALLGAVLAEWLATGQGLGYLMLEASDESRFTTLWAGVVVITVVSVLVYALVSAVETPVLRKYAAKV